MTFYYYWLNKNLPLVIFIYGLAFFLVGFSILLQDRTFSRLQLAASLPWLAASTLIHGLAEWGLLFIPMQEKWMSQGFTSFLWVAEMLMWSLSFLLLCIFGSQLLAPSGTRLPPFLYLALIVFLGWLSWWVGIRLARPGLPFEQWLQLGNIWSRYLLAVPGTIAAALGLWRQQADPSLASLTSARRLRLAAAFFLLYGFFGGLVVPPADFFPASMLNSQVFFHLVGLPVQAFRSLAAAGIAYSIIKVLHVFNLENRQRLADAIRWQALGEERERIARDLHDGAIQSLYAVALYLQRLRMLGPGGQDKWEKELDVALGRLDLSIREMRGLISGLRQDAALPLAERLRGLVQEFAATSGVVASFSAGEPAWEPPPDVAHELYLMIRESLSNVGRHACASRVELIYEASEHGMRVEVVDDGVGFRPETVLRQRGRHGLRNIIERAGLIGAQVNIWSAPEGGTRVTVTLRREEVSPVAQDQAVGG